ncbi:MAG: hypothetical protein BWY53_00825 [Parcubacteria group bacterium ADurb.Bin326]|nr:MAG: hypothetical protein BWY53_00825 [Parcubacteria group bacterium ADurb.Bin326]
MEKTRIYPSITTTEGSDWRQMIKDCGSLGVKEVAFFPSCLDFKQRQDAYALLKDNGINSIPFVHLRSDMEVNELDFLINHFGTKVFNTHCKGYFSPEHDLSKFKDIIYLENASASLKDEINDWAGICLDVSHLEDKRIKGDPLFDEVIEILEKYPCGCWHLNTVLKTPLIDEERGEFYDVHYFSELSDFNYCLAYKKYLPLHIALELENSIPEQLEAKKYIEKILEI